MLEEQREMNVLATHELERLGNEHQEKLKEMEEELARLERKAETQETTIE